MPVYALGAHQPRLPAPDRIWIAPDAHVIGQVDLGADVGVWRARSFIPTWDFP